MPTKRFKNVPAGSILHYDVHVQPPGCAALHLDISVDDVTNPPQVPANGANVVPPLTAPNLANLPAGLAIGPTAANTAYLLELTITFVADGIVALKLKLDEPGGGTKERDPLAFVGHAGDVSSIDVSLL